MQDTLSSWMQHHLRIGTKQSMDKEGAYSLSSCTLERSCWRELENSRCWTKTIYWWAQRTSPHPFSGLENQILDCFSSSSGQKPDLQKFHEKVTDREEKNKIMQETRRNAVCGETRGTLLWVEALRRKGSLGDATRRGCKVNVMDKGQKHMVPINAVPSGVEHRQEETILSEQD